MTLDLSRAVLSAFPQQDPFSDDPLDRALHIVGINDLEDVVVSVEGEHHRYSLVVPLQVSLHLLVVLLVSHLCPLNVYTSNPKTLKLWSVVFLCFEHKNPSEMIRRVMTAIPEPLAHVMLLLHPQRYGLTAVSQRHRLSPSSFRFQLPTSTVELWSANRIPDLTDE